MQDTAKAAIAKEWITKLANGINPIDGSTLKDDDIVNNVHISRCLFYVSEILDTAIQKMKRGKQYELPFHLEEEDLNRIAISERCGITAFVREIKAVTPENMKPITSNQILNHLVSQGFMEEVTDGNKKAKRPTEIGNHIGITTMEVTTADRSYTAVVYNQEAQKYIISLLNQISDELQQEDR